MKALKILIVALALFSFLSAAAQKERNSGQTTKQQPQYAEAVTASLMNGLSKVILFRPSDGIVSLTDLTGGIPSFFIDGTIANISIVSKSETTKDSKGKNYGCQQIS